MKGDRRSTSGRGLCEGHNRLMAAPVLRRGPARWLWSVGGESQWVVSGSATERQASQGRDGGIRAGTPGGSAHNSVTTEKPDLTLADGEQRTWL